MQEQGTIKQLTGSGRSNAESGISAPGVLEKISEFSHLLRVIFMDFASDLVHMKLWVFSVNLEIFLSRRVQTSSKT